MSRYEAFAKILRWQKMLHVPGSRDTVAVLAEAGGLLLSVRETGE